MNKKNDHTQWLEVQSLQKEKFIMTRWCIHPLAKEFQPTGGIERPIFTLTCSEHKCDALPLSYAGSFVCFDSR